MHIRCKNVEKERREGEKEWKEDGNVLGCVLCVRQRLREKEERMKTAVLACALSLHACVCVSAPDAGAGTGSLAGFTGKGDVREKEGEKVISRRKWFPLSLYLTLALNGQIFVSPFGPFSA